MLCGNFDGDRPIFKTIYPATESSIDWLSHRYEVIDQTTFSHFVETYRLRQMVDRAERSKSRTHRFQAYTAVADYAHDTGINVRYEDVRDRISGFLPSLEGGWVVFTDRGHDLLHSQDFTEGILEDFLYCAPECVQTIIVWLVEDDVFVSYRSQFIDFRREVDAEFLLCDGLRRSDDGQEEVLSYALNPELEATIRHDLYQQGGVISTEHRIPIARHVENVSIFDLLVP